MSLCALLIGGSLATTYKTLGPSIKSPDESIQRDQDILKITACGNDFGVSLISFQFTDGIT